MNESRTRISTIQSRLGRTNDRLRRKLLDNTQFLISSATDCIFCKLRQTYEGDPTSMIVEKAEILSAIFPPLTDVPFRKIKENKTTKAWQLTSLIDAFAEDAQEKYYACQIPWEFDVDVGDLLFRIFVDEDNKFPCIIILQVQELLGTIGANKMIMQKVKTTIPTFEIPQQIIDTVQKMAQRRMRLGW